MQILAWPADNPQNPYNRQLYAHIAALGAEVRAFSPLRLLFGADDLLHLHWPDYALSHSSSIRVALKLLALFALLDLAHLRGKKIVWTVHNLAAHDGLHPVLERWFWRALIARLDGYISLSESGKTAAMERFPKLCGLPGFVIPHGHYRESYPSEITREAARKEFGIAPDAPVILFLGNIRAYKNVAQLIAVFRYLQTPAARLLIAGDAEELVLEEINRVAAEDQRVRLFIGYIPVERVQVFMHAADLVVLPFKEILNSGSALLALSFNCPVLVPRRGSMGDLQALVGKEWVCTYVDGLTDEVLQDALNWTYTEKREKSAPLEALEWGAIARQTLDAYQKICVNPK